MGHIYKECNQYDGKKGQNPKLTQLFDVGASMDFPWCQCILELGTRNHHTASEQYWKWL